MAGRAPDEALRAAVATGAASVLRVGAGRFDVREVHRLSSLVQVPRARAGRRRLTASPRACPGCQRLVRRGWYDALEVERESEPVDFEAQAVHVPPGLCAFSRRDPLLSVDVGPEDVERLLALERKFSKEGITFDDVLLVPAESDVLPDQVSTIDPLHAGDRARDSDRLGGDGHRHRGAHGDRARPEGGIGVIHRNLDRGAGRRGGQGQAVGVRHDRRPVTLRPDDLVADALELMERYHISGVPITDETGRLVGILTNRDLRFETTSQQPIANLMTSES